MSATDGRFQFGNIDRNVTIYSEPVDLPRGPAPITVAVEFIEFDANPSTVSSGDPTPGEPQQRLPNPVLTVYYVDDGTFFRVAATNFASLPINQLVVRWWRLDV